MRQIAKSHALPIINNLRPTIASSKKIRTFFQNRLTLIVSISVVGIFDTQLSTYSKIQKTLITITLDYFEV